MVTYQVELSIEDQVNLKNMVPSTPLATPNRQQNTKNAYSLLPEIPSESVIEDEGDDDDRRDPHSIPLHKKAAKSTRTNSTNVAPDHKNISVNLLKNFDEMMLLQDKVRNQYLKNTQIIKFIKE